MNWDMPKVQLILLDKNYVFYRVQQTWEGKFDIIKKIDLSRHVAVKLLVDQLKPYDMISISDRTIISKDKFININSGREFGLLEHSEIRRRGASHSIPVPKSDSIIQVFYYGDMKLVALTEPGTRRADNVCLRGSSKATNVIRISEDSVLY